MKPSEIQFARNLEALRSPQCRRIIQVLFSETRTIPELVRDCELTQGSIEKHLQVLTDAGLVETAVSANETSFRLCAAAFSETHDWFKFLGN